MGNYNFQKDLKESQQSVERVVTFLKGIGCTDVQTNDDGKYDIIYTTREGNRRTAEVKNDLQFSKTGNVAIEYVSRGKPSGISTSKADIWFYVLDGLYICNTGNLRAYLIQHWDRYSRVKGGDEQTSQLILMKMNDFRDIFTKIDVDIE